MKKMIRASALLLLAVLLCGVLAACAPSLDSEKLKTVMTEAGYTVTFGNAELIGRYKEAGVDLDEKLIATLSERDATSGKTTVQYVVVYYFPDVDNAEKATELIAADAAAEKSDLHPDWVEPKRFGNIVYYGTVTAVDIAKD